MSDASPRILIADDQPDVLEALRLLLKGEGLGVETASSPAALLRAAEASEFDVALIDLNYTRDTTSGREGLTLLGKLQALDATLPVVVMTAWGSVDGAVEAMRLGARDYVEKPWDNTRLIATLRTQSELARALRTTGRLAADNQRLRNADARPTLVAESRGMQVVLHGEVGRTYTIETSVDMVHWAPWTNEVNSTAAPVAWITFIACGMTSFPMPSPGITAMRLFAVTMATLAQRCEFLKLHFHVNSWDGRARMPVAPLMLFCCVRERTESTACPPGTRGYRGHGATPPPRSPHSPVRVRRFAIIGG